MNIKLTNGEIAIVDSSDFAEMSKHRWYAIPSSCGTRAKTRIGDKMVFMHRLIMGTPPNGLEIDHINGNVLDNRRCNLRLGTHSQNCANRRVKFSPHGFKGVSLASRPRRNRWCARIRYQNALYDLGHYETPEEAATAYALYALAAFGEFARIEETKP